MDSLGRRFYAILFLVCSFLLSSAQNSNEPLERKLINQYTIEANKLIWHLNLNVKQLKAYQEALNEWYKQANASVKQAPIFQFSKNSNEANLNVMLLNQSLSPNNLAFNYHKTLSSLHKESILFNSYCEQIAKVSKSLSAKDYYKQNLTILYQIDGMAETLVNLCYDFSLSCAINFGKEKLPVELDRLKNVVGQAKNLIMSIRDNNKIQAKSYLNQLNESISGSLQDDKLGDLRRVGKFMITEAEIMTLQEQILSSANQIAFWGEQYLQSNQTKDEVLPILENAILAFNVFEGRAGCSGTYNQLLSNSKAEFLKFTEEPMFFEVSESVQILVQTPKVTPKTEEALLVKDGKIATKSESTTITKVEVFDPKDINSLAGALPNNVIIMMDVSASMKLTGKLPLLKSSIVHLLNIMRPEDRLSLIAYSGKSEVLIAGASVKDKALVMNILDTLHSSGGTDIENGLMLGYNTAKASFMPKGNNRIIIATDGEFGVKGTILKMAQENSIKGIILSIFQFNEAKDDSKSSALRVLSETGRGNYEIIKSNDQALEVLIREVKKK